MDALENLLVSCCYNAEPEITTVVLLFQVQECLMSLVGVTFFSRNVALGMLTKVDSKKTRESVLFSVSVFVSKPSATSLQNNHGRS